MMYVVHVIQNAEINVGQQDMKVMNMNLLKTKLIHHLQYIHANVDTIEIKFYSYSAALFI